MKKTVDRIAEKRQVKEEQIYTVALEFFGKFGYRKTTLEDIAGEFHMTKSGLYRYVRDKRDLYEKAVSWGLTKWQRTALQSIEGVDDALLQLKNYALTGVTYLNKDNDLRNVLLKDPAIFPLNTREDHFADINNESMDILKRILKRGIETKRFRKIDVDHVTSFLYSVYVMFIIKSYVKSDIDSIEAMMNTSLDVLLHGIVKS
ncbi:MAG TPA: TetR/AcrR family transcriptional regulator [Spirochaetota bacterium]|nr:TetR/AcrR family transcriptional regulator [Spirochaetota bacterium]HPI88949.1 TetR/AcrR family transcriptional regulator [Spirochaetota bacterium]HPR46574.1 TetR/AcrR family transcriptional regulator [Spirochaetota bacterium]